MILIPGQIEDIDFNELPQMRITKQTGGQKS